MIIEYDKKKILYIECDNIRYLTKINDKYYIIISNISNIKNTDKDCVAYLESWQNLSLGACIIEIQEIDMNSIIEDINSQKPKTKYYHIEDCNLSCVEYDMKGMLYKCIFQSNNILTDITRKFKIQNLFKD